MSAKVLYLDYEPQPRQQILHQTKARFVLYGGSAGGAKRLLLTMVATLFAATARMTRTYCAIKDQSSIIRELTKPAR